MPTTAIRLRDSARQKQRGHVLPRAPLIDLNSPGRLRTAHVLALCAVSHSTLYQRIKAGTFPRPDGRDGGQNYWSTATILSYLNQ
jgi:predicted DNA-binding transcriptional regulator AlpA